MLGKNGRGLWPSRTGFLLAAMGSAMGLGNVWRFPYLAYKYGGGAFLIPYLIALFTTGIPILILELGIGKNMQTSPPFAFERIRKKFGWFGWVMLLVSFVIIAYYTVVIGWSIAYMGKSLFLSWGASPEQHFYHDFIGKTSGPGTLGGLDIGLLISVLITWAVIYWVVLKGVKRVSKVVTVTVPLPAVLLLILGVRALTLPGASIGLNYYLTPNFNALLDPEVWLAAYAQVFFTLSLAGGVMIAYSSRLGKTSDVNNNAHIISLMNCALSFFAGIVVLSTLGYVAYSTGTPIETAAESGPALAFVVYPIAISLLPTGAAIFGLVFFLTLFLLGIDSAFALIEALVMGFKDAGLNRKKALGIVSLIGVLLSLLFATGGGYHWLSIVDQFFNEIGLVAIGIVECLLIGYIFGPDKLKNLCNATSEIKIGKWWVWSIKYITPSILGIILLTRFVDLAISGQTGYPMWAVFLGGWVPLGIILLISLHFGRRWKK